MARKDGINIAIAITSCIVLICGVTLSILTYVMVHKIAEVITRVSEVDVSSPAPLFLIGFIFIIPGVVGILAALIHMKGGFVTQMVFGVIALIVLAMSFFFDLRATSSRTVFDSQTCYTFHGVCKCSHAYQSSLLRQGFSCEEVASVINMGVGTDVMVLFGAIFTFITIGLAGKYACSRKV